MEYRDKELEELGGKGGINSKKLKEKITELNQRLQKKSEDWWLKKALKTL